MVIAKWGVLGSKLSILARNVSANSVKILQKKKDEKFFTKALVTPRALICTKKIQTCIDVKLCPCLHEQRINDTVLPVCKK